MIINKSLYTTKGPNYIQLCYHPLPMGNPPWKHRSVWACPTWPKCGHRASHCEGPSNYGLFILSGDRMILPVKLWYIYFVIIYVLFVFLFWWVLANSRSDDFQPALWTSFRLKIDVIRYSKLHWYVVGWWCFFDMGVYISYHFRCWYVCGNTIQYMIVHQSSIQSRVTLTCERK